MPYWVSWVMVAFVIFHIIVELSLEIHQCCMHKRNKGKAHWTIQHSLLHSLLQGCPTATMSHWTIKTFIVTGLSNCYNVTLDNKTFIVTFIITFIDTFIVTFIVTGLFNCYYVTLDNKTFYCYIHCYRAVQLLQCHIGSKTFFVTFIVIGLSNCNIVTLDNNT